MPAGTPTLTSGGDGFVKLKGAQTNWVNAHQFSTHTSGDTNPDSTVVFHEGVHTHHLRAALDRLSHRLGAGDPVSTFEPEPRRDQDRPGDRRRQRRLRDRSRPARARSSSSATIDGDAQSVGLRFAGIGLDGRRRHQGGLLRLRGGDGERAAARSLTIEVQDATRPNTYSAPEGAGRAGLSRRRGAPGPPPPGRRARPTSRPTSPT